MTSPGDLLFAVLGVQLGYLSPDDALACARELALPGERRTMAQWLVARGVLDRARAQVLERLAARAAEHGGGDAAQTLELLPAELRALAAQTVRHEASAPAAAGPGLVDEQPHRYFAAPRADAPPLELGRGEFAQVVLKHDTVLGRDVAWKQPWSSSREAAARLADEARQAARLDHPAAVPVYELGRTAAGATYFTMRRVPGRTLAQAITDARTPAERLALLPAFQTVCRCLAVAHEQQVTHRSLSADSVMLGQFGEVYVVGWGPPTDEASGATDDVRALGALLHEVVTGLPPPVMGQVSARGLPADLLAVVRGALDGSVTAAEGLANDVQAFLSGRRVANYHYSSVELLRRFVQRHRLFSVMAAVAFVLIGSAAGWGATRVAAERDRARHFARRFLDDVALRLRAQPGVEPLLEQVTGAALAHYQRTTEVARLPADERLRVAGAMARLGGVSASLSRREEAERSLSFAASLAAGLEHDAARSAEARLVLAQVALTRSRQALVAGAVAPVEEARRAVGWADGVLAQRPESLEARLLAAQARVEVARLTADRAAAGAAFDAAVGLLAAALPGPEGEAQRLDVRGAVLLARLAWRWPELDASAREAGARDLVTSLTEARARRPDDVEAQLRGAQGLLLLAGAIEARSVVDARGPAEQALALGRAVIDRRPDLHAGALALVEGELLAGRPLQAAQRARAFERHGVAGLEVLAARAALLSGDLDGARGFTQKAGGAPGPELVLVRALATALLDRPGDAVIQARALKGQLAATGWPPLRLETFLAALAAPPTPGLEGVREFSRRWAAGDEAGAVDGWVAALERQLRGP